MGGGRRRFRAGAQAPINVGWSLFLLLMAAAFVAVAVTQHRPWYDVAAAVLAVGAFVWLLSSVNGLRRVHVDTEPPRTLSIPTFSLRRGYGRTVWSLDDVMRVELARTMAGWQFSYWSVRFVGRRGEIYSDSLTCGRRRREPERTRAGREVAEIRELVEYHRPW